jgi:hypothetical protein
MKSFGFIFFHLQIFSEEFFLLDLKIDFDDNAPRCYALTDAR